MKASLTAIVCLLLLAPIVAATEVSFFKPPTANGNQGGHRIRVVDRRGRFVRQIFPFPADLPYENVKATGVFRDDEGNLVPHIHNWHSLNLYLDTVLRTEVPKQERPRLVNRIHGGLDSANEFFV